MNPVEIILQKKDGKDLSPKQTHYFIQAFVDGRIPDYQMSALLMAICFQGMNMEETVALTKSMIDSGEQIFLSSIQGKTCDKHSTGGVGDKTTLVVAPMVAACGLKVAKLSGRGLGHTGGTLDKLKSFDGINYKLEKDAFEKQLNEIGLCVAGQSANLVPADKKMYALRDVTGTVQSLPLIASSIMSKKLAIHTNAIVLDVKYGTGALMKTLEDAKELAFLLVKIGNAFDRKTTAVISCMDQPLGYAVGNILEVKEAINCLNGKGPKDLMEVCYELACQMLINSGLVESHDKAMRMLKHAISEGKALEKLRAMIAWQGGKVENIDNIHLFRTAKYREPIKAANSGYIKAIDALDIGNASVLLGAGRKTKDDVPDLTAGIIIHKKIDDEVQVGDVLAELHFNEGVDIQEAQALAVRAFKFNKSDPSQPLIAGIIDNEGFHTWNKS